MARFLKVRLLQQRLMLRKDVKVNMVKKDEDDESTNTLEEKHSRKDEIANDILKINLKKRL